MDVTVMGLVSGTYIIEDIQMDVPHCTVVTIPAEKAHRSKDLWRGISSKQLFQIRTAPVAHPAPPHVNGVVEKELRDKQRLLETENEELRQKLVDQHVASHRQSEDFTQAMAIQREQLDKVINLLAAGVTVGGGSSSQPTAKAVSEVVSGEVPTFIPSSITPKNADARIDIKTTETDSSVSDAAGKLRGLRQKNR